MNSTPSPIPADEILEPSDDCRGPGCKVQINGLAGDFCSPECERAWRREEFDDDIGGYSYDGDAADRAYEAECERERMAATDREWA